MTQRTLVKYFAGILFLVLLPFWGEACRYTVRDIGYSPISADNWSLLVYSHSSELLRHKKKIEALNINSGLNLICLDKDNIPDKLQSYYDSGKSVPQYVLLKQKENANSFSLRKPDEAFESPLRKELKGLLLRNFAVVLILEGTDGKSDEIESSLWDQLEKFNQTLSLMPKPVEIPPAILKLSRNKFKEEQLLLQILGFSAENEGSGACVIYGRGRLMGKIMGHEEVNRGDVIKMLNLIGADCECGQDRDWLLGTLLPFSWTEWELKTISRNIKVDIQNPMTLVEMGQIVSKEVYKSDDNTEITFAPKETELPEKTQTFESVPEVEFQKKVDYQYQSKSTWGMWPVVIVFVIVVICIALFLFWRRQKRLKL